MKSQMKPNTDIQIGNHVAYVPYHAKGDITHSDVEYGTVTSIKLLENGEYTIFVRFPTSETSQGCKLDQLQKVL
jgi:hypothetical protein